MGGLATGPKRRGGVGRRRGRLGISLRLAETAVLATGAASGMGRVAVRMFAEQGASVVALDRLEGPLREAVAEAGPDGGEGILPVVPDVTDGDAVRRAVAAGVDRFGTLNVLYNNAGIMPDEDTSVEETSAETWRRHRPWGCPLPPARHPGALRRRRRLRRQHRLVRLAGGLHRAPGCLHRHKGAVLSLTRSPAGQYGHEGIRANAICPGPVLTPLLESLLPSDEEKAKRPNRIPFGCFGLAEDVVQAGRFRASDESSWMTGSTFVVDGGITVNDV